MSTARSPVAIGGVGGSGTRLVAQFLLDLGFFLGGDLNDSNDNLWFTLLFKRRELLQAPVDEVVSLVTVFRQVMSSGDPLSADQLALIERLANGNRPDHDAEWLRNRVQSLASWANGSHIAGAWGWKEPNTHVVLQRIESFLPGTKYIHVMRNGLDMAYSSNQAQLHLWGPHFLGLEQIEASPRLSLKYWHVVHRRVLEHGQTMGNRFLLLNYDRLCTRPAESLNALMQFLGVEPDGATRDRLLAAIHPPRTLGRFRLHPPADLDPEDVAFARDLGFDTSW